jgi:hypothetical protein
MGVLVKVGHLITLLGTSDDEKTLYLFFYHVY